MHLRWIIFQRSCWWFGNISTRWAMIEYTDKRCQGEWGLGVCIWRCYVSNGSGNQNNRRNYMNYVPQFAGSIHCYILQWWIQLFSIFVRTEFAFSTETNHHGDFFFAHFSSWKKLISLKSSWNLTGLFSRNPSPSRCKLLLKSENLTALFAAK